MLYNEVTLDAFIKNQKAELIREKSTNPNPLRVVVYQKNKTPGIIVKRVKFEPQSKYTITLNIDLGTTSQVYLWTNDNATSRSFFVSPGRNDLHITVEDNVLMDIAIIVYKPARGQMFTLKSFEIIKNSKIRKVAEIPKILFDASLSPYNINNYFDRIFVVNLDKDTTKWSIISTMFEKLGIKNYERFAAVNGYTQPYLSQWYKLRSNRENKCLMKKPSVLGMTYSFTSVLNIAKERKYRNILYLEDDVIFSKDFNAKFERFARKLPEWKILYLGLLDYKINRKPRLNENTVCYYPTTDIDGGFAVALDASVYDMAINDCSKMHLPPDSGAMRNIVGAYPDESFAAYPNLVIANLSADKTRIDENMIRKALRWKWDVQMYDFSAHTNHNNQRN